MGKYSGRAAPKNSAPIRKSGAYISVIISGSTDAANEETNERIDGLAGTQTKSQGHAEADSDARPRSNGQRARAEPPRTQRDDQSGDDRESGPRRAKRRAHPGGQLQRRKFPQGRNGESSGKAGAQSFRRVRRRQLLQPIPRYGRRRRSVSGARGFRAPVVRKVSILTYRVDRAPSVAIERNYLFRRRSAGRGEHYR